MKTHFPHQERVSYRSTLLIASNSQNIVSRYWQKNKKILMNVKDNSGPKKQKQSLYSLKHSIRHLFVTEKVTFLAFPLFVRLCVEVAESSVQQRNTENFYFAHILVSSLTRSSPLSDCPHPYTVGRNYTENLFFLDLCFCFVFCLFLYQFVARWSGDFLNSRQYYRVAISFSFENSKIIPF